MLYVTLPPFYLHMIQLMRKTKASAWGGEFFIDEGLKPKQFKGLQLVQSHVELLFSFGISSKSGTFCLLQFFPNDRWLLCLETVLY